MIGMKFIRDTGADSIVQDANSFRWDRITLMSDLIPFRTVIREVDNEWREAMGDPHARLIHSHYHHIMALCDGDIFEICWDELSELLALGVYVIENSLGAIGGAR